MDKRLDDIITYYEEEKSKLRQLIDGYISDQNYLNAHIISREVLNIDKRLQRFYILNDDLYDQKSRMESINTLENLIDLESSEYMQDYYRNSIAIHRDELKKLERQKEAEKLNGTENTLEKALGMLIYKRIRMFKIIFNRHENVYCELKLVKGYIQITIPRIRRLLNLFWFGDYKFNQLLNLGFELHKKPNRLVIKLPGVNREDLASTKILLSRIVFEVFDRSQLENQTFIEHEEKASR